MTVSRCVRACALCVQMCSHSEDTNTNTHKHTHKYTHTHTREKRLGKTICWYGKATPKVTFHHSRRIDIAHCNAIPNNNFTQYKSSFVTYQLSGIHRKENENGKKIWHYPKIQFKTKLDDRNFQFRDALQNYFVLFFLNPDFYFQCSCHSPITGFICVCRSSTFFSPSIEAHRKQVIVNSLHSSSV